MDLSTSVLGSTAVKSLQERTKTAVLNIGADGFTRGQLARVECFNFMAAANLSHILNKEMKVRDTKDVYDHISPESLALPRLGVISLAVLGAAFEAKGLGGNAPLETWVRKHLHNGNDIVSFTSIKERDQKELATERKERKRRKHARRNVAHAKRVERFTERAQ